MKQRTKTITAWMLSVLLGAGLFFPALTGGAVAYADGSLAEKFEETNVLDDLTGSTIDGQKFNAAEYKITLGKDTALLHLAEFCYAKDTALQGDWGLYLYVYNPKKYQFVNNPQLNRAQLSFGSAENYHKYPLQFLNASVEEGYEGLFYKYKVIMTDAQRKEALSALDPDERIYRMGEIELQRAGEYNAQAVSVAKTFYYTGFVQGYGSTSGNLDSRSQEQETITLRKDKGEVGFTWYRPDGSNGKNDYTQDSLHSVYFVVPNSFIERFGDMTEVHATWRDAVLAPALVTGNEEAFDAITPYLGEKMDPPDIGLNDLGLFYVGASIRDLSLALKGYTYSFGFNVPGSTSDSKVGLLEGDPATGDTFKQRDDGRSIDPLYMMYFSGNEDDSADTFKLRPDEIVAKLKSYTAKYGGDLVNGKYSGVLFDSVAEEWSDKTFKNTDKTQPLTKEVIDSTWWERLWGSSHVQSHQVFDGIEAIHTVTQDDFSGTDAEVSKRLYIGEESVEELKLSFDKYSSDHTMFLLRYQVSDYVAQEATLGKRPDLFSGISHWDIDTNAYFFQETVNLDFDIIDVTFSNGEKDVNIPVAMTPFDVIPGSSPPLNTHTDKGGCADAARIVKVMLILAVTVVAIYAISWIVNKIMRKSADSIKPNKHKRE